MPTAIGKKLRSRKVQLACEKRQSQLNEKHAYQSFRRDTDLKSNAGGANEEQNLLGMIYLQSPLSPLYSIEYWSWILFIFKIYRLYMIIN